MKPDLTILIWDQLDTELRFAVLQGDYRHLNKCYINQGLDQEAENELCELMYLESGPYKVHLSDEFPIITAKLDNVCVIVAGFLP